MSEMDTDPKNKLARKLMVDLSIMTVIGIAMAFIGPFGSFEQPLAYRLVAWLSFAYLGYAIYSPMSFVVEKLGGALDLPRPGLWVAAVLFATIPMTVAVWSIGFLPGPIRIPTLEQGLTSYMYVLIVGGGVTALFYALESREVAPDARAVSQMADGSAAEPVQPDSQIRFLERLPPNLGTNLIALEMEDHYVRAHTDLGSDLILLRMRDAVAELDGMDGAQVHRSWWVARSAVEGSRREGRNIRLQLSGGLEAPVSRGAAPDLKEQGWF
ncbi:LytTR family DNA-binding domain-containing protein [Pontixanthobacter sp. CEM42]|uniref:LytTR family DNA-binding domain-containing protein n=1 Tax=Pontixanthobacter sp. CEM42 TaxID=2792077 RepID=UPI001AE01F3D|nr:LytTR family DNA-binding domain-containing protein [Pontixanthobacter sp. CEM42]